MLQTIKIALIILISLVMTACGGGGGGSSGTTTQTSTATFQIKAAYLNYTTSTEAQNFTLSATYNGVHVGGSGTVTTGGFYSTVFEGASAFAKSTSVTGTVYANGVNAPYGGSATLYVDSNYMPLGESSTVYAVVRAGANIPSTGKVGDTGTWSTADIYTDSTKTVKNGTTVVSYFLEPDTLSTAILNTISTEQDNDGNTSVTTIKFRITPAGQITMLSKISTNSSTSVTITYN